MNIASRRVVIALAAAACSGVSLAHEFWLEASAFRVRAGEMVGVRTLVGDGLVGESRPRDPTKLERFEIAGADGVKPVVGRDGSDPAGLIRIATPGTYVLGYRSGNTPVVLAGPKFEVYLREKGLDNPVEARRAAGNTETDGRERFSRCAKAIIEVRDAGGAGVQTTSGFDHNFGFPFEIIPSENPYSLHAGNEMTFVMFADGKPIAGVLVTAANKCDPKSVLSARSGEDGRVKFKLEKPGMWLINSVRMLPVKEPGVECDWQSLWASLTFDLAATPEESAKVGPSTISAEK